MNKRSLLIFLLFTIFMQIGKAMQVKSPNGRIVLNTDVHAGHIYYELSRDGSQILKPSRLGMTLKDGRLDNDLSLKHATRPAMTKHGDRYGEKTNMSEIIITD